MNTTRQKRPDRVICKWKGYSVELDERELVAKPFQFPFGYPSLLKRFKKK